MKTPLEPRRVAILVYPGVQSLDLTGPLEVFAATRQVLKASGSSDPGYTVQIVAPSKEPIRTSSGLTIVPDVAISEARERIDTLLIAGGSGRSEVTTDPALLAWIAAVSSRVRRTASVCTGAFLLADAGILDGRRATTHWAYAAELQRRHPEVEVDPEPIFVRDGQVWTSAGVTAGMDLALALVEEDFDRDLALTIARHLVLFLRRPGNQSQFSATLVAQQPAREPLREIQRLVLEDVGGEHSVEAMAARAHLSPRHFARAFTAETGVTPARYVESVRLEAARRRLEETHEPIGEIARVCGFGTDETMRRVFLRVLQVGPAEYRRRFHTHAKETVR
jgi:transcriptional regulator GlxA family with amidase domain